MRRASGIVVALAAAGWGLAVGAAQGEPPGRGPALAPAPAVAEQAKRRQLTAILQEWERRSAVLSALEASFTRVDTSWAFEQKDVYVGTASLKRPDLARLEFYKVDRTVQPPRWVAHERIVCTGSAVLQYTFPTKQIFVYPIPREERKRALEEGPLPFLFDMHARQLEARYRLALRGEERDAYVFDVVPLLNHDKEVFGRARLWLNTRTFLPDKLLLYDLNGKDTKEYTFRAIRTNPALDPGLFKPEGQPGWTIVKDNDPVPPAAARPQARGPAPRARPR
jgi:TIGR03009 family protein